MFEKSSTRTAMSLISVFGVLTLVGGGIWLLDGSKSKADIIPTPTASIESELTTQDLPPDNLSHPVPCDPPCQQQGMGWCCDDGADCVECCNDNQCPTGWYCRLLFHDCRQITSSE